MIAEVMDSDTPYLTIVATTRNDDHGGNLMQRTQAFVSSLIEQCEREKYDCELIIVEWNPPPDRPRLAAALQWPERPNYCDVRIIEVAPDVHAGFKHSKSLPLYQMIAKNVGIRRARGRFVLATNIDILFNDSLMKLLFRKRLSPNCFYRIDRYDVANDVPVGVGHAAMIAFCEKNQLRINKRSGTLDLRTNELSQIYKSRLWTLSRLLAACFPPLGILMLRGWAGRFFVHELLPIGPRVFRRVVNVLTPPPFRKPLPPLTFRLFGPYRQLFTPFTVAAFEKWREKRRKRKLRRPRRYRFVQERVRWPWLARPIITARYIRNISRAYFKFVKYCWGDFRFEVMRGRLHTNACGDFTLLARERWFRLQGYAEYEMYSFHIDSLLCHAAQCSGMKERVIREPARIYHIEHKEGSGFTPEGQAKLWRRIATEGIGRLSDEEFWITVMKMRQGKHDFVLNEYDWGLPNYEFLETNPFSEFSPHKRHNRQTEDGHSPAASGLSG